jgi:hypothetical protein
VRGRPRCCPEVEIVEIVEMVEKDVPTPYLVLPGTRGRASQRIRVEPWLLRAALIGGSVVTMLGIASALHPAPSSAHADLELARLLRAMAAIKGASITAGMIAVVWRLGWPISGRLAAGYLAGSWSIAGAWALIWQQSHLAAAALAFHVSVVVLLVTVALDRGGSESNAARVGGR